MLSDCLLQLTDCNVLLHGCTLPWVLSFSSLLTSFSSDLRILMNFLEACLCGCMCSFFFSSIFCPFNDGHSYVVFLSMFKTAVFSFQFFYWTRAYYSLPLFLKLGVVFLVWVDFSYFFSTSPASHSYGGFAVQYGI